MNDSQKLIKLRAEMAKVGVAAFLVPRTDEYQGEYVAENAERLAWLTGFTGSAGMAMVTADKAVVMSDGRYTIQLISEVDADLYECVNSQKVKPEEWLKAHCGVGDGVGYDPRLHTPTQIKEWQAVGLTLKPVPNLIDKIWTDRPDAPCSKAFLFDEKFAGQSAATKIEKIQIELKAHGADGVVLTKSDSIAWLLNVRGNDIAYIPVVLSYAFLPVQGKVKWFVDRRKISKIASPSCPRRRASIEKLETLDPRLRGGDDLEILSNLSNVEFIEENDIEDFLKSLSGKKIICDPKRSSIWFQNILKVNGAIVIEADDPCIAPRSQKNKAEQAAMKAAHIRDGVAMVKFFKWFESANNITELDVEEKLEEFRAQAPEFKEPSFNTIAGFGSNGAIVHYRATQKSNKKIEKGNLLLLDSGAQYIDGTTDITRTIAVGKPTQEMKERYTLVLKGHIALAAARFKKETLGKELDALARQFLQEKGLDYAHGTGHGVGCYLSVHEEAAKGISPRADAPLKAGMILSNEPGYYKEGEYGIRIENLILVKEEGEDLYFETITFCPLDKNLIVVDMLAAEEVKWVNEYHAQVFEKLSPLLDTDHIQSLKEKTAEIKPAVHR